MVNRTKPVKNIPNWDSAFNNGTEIPSSRTAADHPPTEAAHEIGTNQRTARLKSMGVRQKTALSVLALGTLPLIVASGIIYTTAQRALRQQTFATHQQNAEQVAKGLHQFMAERYRDIQGLANLPILANPRLRSSTSNAEQQAVLKQFMLATQAYDNIAVFNANGAPILQTGTESLPNQRDNAAFQQVVKSKQPLITQPTAAADGTTKIYLFAPVQEPDSDRVTKVVRASMPASVLESLLQANDSQGARYQVIDNSGKVFIAEGKEQLGRSAQEAFSKLEPLLTAQVSGIFETNRSTDQPAQLLSYAPLPRREGLPNLQWGVILGKDTQVALAPQRSLSMQFLLGSGLMTVLSGAIAVWWANRATRSLVKTTQLVQQITHGDLDTRLVVQGEDEMATLGTTINQMAEQIQHLQRTQVVQAKRAKLVADLTSNIRQTLDFDTILRTSVDGVRQVFDVDRAVIYRFHPDFKSGEVTAESVGEGWGRALGQIIHDPLLPDSVARYKLGRVTMVENLETANLSQCHCEILERLEVKANIVAPILVGDDLIGLLCAHQCRGPRYWEQTEIELIQQLSTQIGYALSQAALLKQQSDTALRERQQGAIVARMRECSDEDSILQVAVRETRTALESDRVLVYLFDQNWSGRIVAESVERRFPIALGAQIADPCFAEGYVEKYRQGRVQATNNIMEAGLTDCHLMQLKPFEVKANLVAPILVEGRLKGLFVAHQCDAPREWSDLDMNFMRQIAIQLGFALEQASLFQKQKRNAEQAYQLKEIMAGMRQSLRREDIFHATVDKLRYALKADRVVIYEFNPDWSGTITAESVASGWRRILHQVVADPFREGLTEEYRNGRVRAMADVNQEEIADCHRDILENFEIRASIVAPILRQGDLIGLISVHQCAGPRLWQEEEVGLVSQVATQLTFALEQSDLFEEREKARLQAEAISQEQRQQKESLQMQLVELLRDVEGVAQGDLTVRADVTAADIGTVADFFNAIVESLRQIVTQVKASATQVNTSLGQNEEAMRQLAEEALQQAEETTRTLASVEQMTRSIAAVAESAQQAAQVARHASTTAAAGGTAIDRTVHNILNLRETVGETAKKVKRLGESSQQISKVVSLINQIAMQTNLLAINAGIEAARAGEEGQGFAVVAEEVGELAARSAAATQEIEKIVEAIQRETSEVVEAMEQSTAQVVEGTHLVDDAKRSLSQILEVSQQIDQLVQSISTATVSQAATSASVSQLMQQIAAVSERTSRSSRQVSDSLRETVRVAQDLQASVGAFKVGAEV
jgi:methyl-accepting chemotaxis protein PixJ